MIADKIVKHEQLTDGQYIYLVEEISNRNSGSMSEPRIFA